VATQNKVLLDRLVGTPSAWALNLMARAVAPVLQRSHRTDPASVKTIVVAKLLGLGSIIQSTPLLLALRRAYPNARLYFLTTRTNRSLVDRLGSVDEGIYLDDRQPLTFTRDTLTALAGFARTGIDLYFDLEIYSAASSCLSLISLARNRFGLYRHSAGFKRGLFTHLLYFNVNMPIRQIYLQLLGMADVSGPFPTELERIALRPEDHAGLAAQLAAAGIRLPERYVVVNPNASDLLLERRWPPEHFARLIDMLVAAGHHPVLTGAPSERAYVDSLWQALPERARAGTTNLAGVIGLAELFALVEGAACVITNDTGPMHVAFSLRRPTVCLFGPGSPAHYGIDRDDVQIIYKGIFCSPCIYETDEPPCAGQNLCMQWITPSEVFDAAERLLSGRPAEDWRKVRIGQLEAAPGQPLGMFSRADRRGRGL
jgi:ADP-heptose:LPS heptosyltransferase